MHSKVFLWSTLFFFPFPLFLRSGRSWAGNKGIYCLLPACKKNENPDKLKKSVREVNSPRLLMLAISARLVWAEKPSLDPKRPCGCAGMTVVHSIVASSTSPVSVVGSRRCSGPGQRGRWTRTIEALLLVPCLGPCHALTLPCTCHTGLIWLWGEAVHPGRNRLGYLATCRAAYEVHVRPASGERYMSVPREKRRRRLCSCDGCLADRISAANYVKHRYPCCLFLLGITHGLGTKVCMGSYFVRKSRNGNPRSAAKGRRQRETIVDTIYTTT